MKDYIKQAIRTESRTTIDDDDSRLVHAVLGLISEYIELDEANAALDMVNFLEEIGDMLWYLAIIADVFGFETIEEMAALGTDRPVTPPEMADPLKRAIYYGDEKSRHVLLLMAATIAQEMLRDYDLPTAMQKNIAKLRVRYPERFDSTKALERDLEAEAEVLA